MPKEYIKLRKLNGQKVRNKYYVTNAVRHPAKGDIPMMIWILERFVKDGEIVLDPMAGIGTTLLEGMRLFPKSLFIGIELEHKFVKWTNASIKKTESIARENWFMKIGKAICIQGDARDLERVLKKKVDKIVSSPPYSQKNEPFASKSYLKIRKEKGRDTSQPSQNYIPYSQDPSNIGNLAHGNVNKIITSAPFGQAQSGGGIAKKGYTGDKHSPTDLIGKRSYMPENTGQDKKNISNLPYIDKVISSPPYEGTVSPYTGGAPMPEDKGPHIGCRNIRTGYTKDRNNLGNIKGKSYLEAMLLVYQQCFKVLKPDGLMVLITKDFIRNKKRVRLGEDTIKLCEMAGFKHFHTYYRKIENPSFWRILYQQKHPEVEQIDCEDILCFRKENEN